MLFATASSATTRFAGIIQSECIVEDPVISAYLKHLQDRHYDYLAVAKPELNFNHTLNRKLNDRSASKGY
jgi:hypothetical protein